jgi:hypothetical protein
MYLVLSHLSRDEVAFSVSCFSSPIVVGCRSGALPARLEISVSASTGRLDTATRLVKCRRAATHRSSHRDRSQYVVLFTSWVRREILLLRWRTPHDANVSSILPALPDAYWRCFNVPNTTAKTMGLLTTRAHGNRYIFDYRATSVLHCSPISVSAPSSLRFKVLSLAVSTCSFVYRIWQSLISGG